MANSPSCPDLNFDLRSTGANSDLGTGADVDASARLSNFLKSRVWVRQGTVIKNIYIYIFYILLSIFFYMMVKIYQFKSNGKYILINLKAYLYILL